MIIIAGYGFVGKAHYEVFKDFFNFQIVDPQYNNFKIAEFNNVDGLICAVPTPPNADGTCNINHVIEVLSETKESIPVLIKSTIDLNGWKQIKEQFPNHKIAFSPEFLKAASAVEDLSNLNHVIISGDGVSFWGKFYKKRFKKARVHWVNPEEAIATKYFVNSFLATKVSFFNQLYEFCNHNDINFDSVREAVCLDSRIGSSHSFVDDSFRRGWGGMCFPKDTFALLKMAEESKTNLSILAETVEYNQRLRKP